MGGRFTQGGTGRCPLSARRTPPRRPAHPTPPLLPGTGHSPGGEAEASGHSRKSWGGQPSCPRRLEFTPSREGGVGRASNQPSGENHAGPGCPARREPAAPIAPQTLQQPRADPPFKSPGIRLEALEPRARLPAGDPPTPPPRAPPADPGTKSLIPDQPGGPVHPPHWTEAVPGGAASWCGCGEGGPSRGRAGSAPPACRRRRRRVCPSARARRVLWGEVMCSICRSCGINTPPALRPATSCCPLPISPPACPWACVCPGPVPQTPLAWHLPQVTHYASGTTGTLGQDSREDEGLCPGQLSSGSGWRARNVEIGQLPTQHPAPSTLPWCCALGGPDGHIWGV